MNAEVAKAIGWTAVRREDNDYADGGRSVWVWTQWVDSDGVDVDQYTVDDLLTWLARHEWCTTVDYLINHETPALVTLRSNVYPSMHPDMAPTLLVALERAVLAVANTEGTR